MKTFKLTLAALTLFAAFTFSSCKEETPVVVEEVVAVEDGLSGEFAINTDASTLSWLGKKVTGEHSGSIKIQEGSFTIDKNVLTSGNILMDMTTISVGDLTDAEENAQLIEHLNSEDFFNTALFPTAAFVINKTDNASAAGDLTIKGITNRVKFGYTLTESETEITVEGTLIVDRTLYDIKYGSGKFFEKLGDKAINDEFELKFKMVSTK